MQTNTSWNAESRVTAIVRDQFRTADVFRKYDISFCCGGNVPLAMVCANKGLVLEELLYELDSASKEQCLPPLDFANWPLDFLTEYIGHVYHSYLEKNLENTASYLSTFLLGHQQKFPELLELETVYQKLSSEMTSHIRQEREVLFPYIRQVYHAYRNKESYARLLVRTLRKPVEEILLREQKGILFYLNRMRTLTQEYVLPEKTCPQHRVCFLKMKELDQMIRQELSLENDSLFPRAVAMEKELLLTA